MKREIIETLNIWASIARFLTTLSDEDLDQTHQLFNDLFEAETERREEQTGK